MESNTSSSPSTNVNDGWIGNESGRREHDGVVGFENEGSRSSAISVDKKTLASGSANFSLSGVEGKELSSGTLNVTDHDKRLLTNSDRTAMQQGLTNNSQFKTMENSLSVEGDDEVDSPLSMQSIPLTPTVERIVENTSFAGGIRSKNNLNSTEVREISQPSFDATNPSFSPPSQSSSSQNQLQSRLNAAKRTQLLQTISTTLPSNNTSPITAGLSTFPSSTRSNSSTFSTNSTLSTTSTTSLISGAEYAIKFPPGPIQLELEPALLARGIPIGCSVSKVLPEFQKPTYVPLSSISWSFASPSRKAMNENAEIIKSSPSDRDDTFGGDEEQLTIQTNDLVVAINGISVLSRKFEIITDLLKRFRDSEKTVMFRSVEKAYWLKNAEKLRNKYGRNSISGLMLDRYKENNQWVETPAKMSIERTPLPESSLRFSNFGNDGNHEEISNERDEMTERKDRSESILATWATPTPSENGSNNAILFSPSNVKKLSRTRSEITSQMFTSKKQSIKNETQTIGSIDSKSTSASETRKRDGTLTERIGKVLVGKSASIYDFERIVRLKKDVIKEIDNVRMALVDANIKAPDKPYTPKSLTAIASRNDFWKDALATNRENKTREKLIEEAEQLSKSLGPDSINFFIEKLVDAQLVLRDEKTKSYSMQKEIEELRVFIADKDHKISSISLDVIDRSATISELRKTLHDTQEAFESSSKRYQLTMEASEKESMNAKSNLEFEVAELKGLLNHAEKEKNASQKKIASMQAQLNEANEKAAHIKNMSEELVESNQALRESEKAIREKMLKNQAILDEVLTASASLKEELNLKQRLIDESAATTASQKEIIERMRVAADEMQRSSLDLTNEVSRLKSELEQALMQVERGVHSESEIERLKAELSLCRSTQAEEVEKLENIIQQKENDSAEYFKLHAAEKLKAEENSSVLTAKLDAANCDILAARKCIVELQTKLDEEAEIYREKQTGFRGQLEIKDCLLASKEDDLTELLRKVESLQIELSSLQEKNSCQEADHRAAVERYEEEKSKLVQRLNEVERQRDETRLQLEESSSASAEAEKVLEKEKDSLKKRLGNAEAKILGIESELRSKLRECKDQAAAIRDAEKNSSLLECSLANLQHEFLVKEEENQSLKKENSNFLLRLQSLESQLHEARSTIDAFELMKSAKEELRSELELNNRRLEERESQLLCIRSTAASLEEEVLSLQRDLELANDMKVKDAENFESEKSDLLHRLKLLESDRACVRFELENSTNSLSEMKFQLMNEIESLKGKVFDGESSRLDLMNQLEQKDRLLDQKEMELGVAHERKSELEVRLSNLQNRLKNAADKSKIDFETIQNENADLRHRLQDVESKCDHALDEFENAQSARRALETKFSEERRSLEEMASEAESAQSELRLKLKTAENKNSEKEAALANAFERMVSLEGQVLCLQREIKERESDFECLISNLLERLQSSGSELSNVMVELEKSRTEVSELTKKLLDEQALKKKNESDWKRMHYDLRFELSNKEAQLTEISDTLNSKEREMSLLIQNVESSENKRKSAINQCEVEKSERLKLLETLEKVSSDRSELIGKIQILELELAGAKQSLHEKESQFQLLAAINDESNCKVESMALQRQLLEKQVCDLKEQLDEDEETNAREKMVCTENRRVLSEDLEDLRETTESIVKEKTQLQESLELAQSQFSEKECFLVAKVERLTSELEKQKKEKEDIMSKLESHKEKLANDRKQLDDLLVDVQQQLKLSDQSAESERMTSKAKENALLNENNELIFKLSAKEKQLASVQSMNEDLESTKNILQQKTAELDTELHALRSKCNDLEKCRNEMSLEISSLTTVFQDRNDRLSNIDSKLESMTEVLHLRTLENDVLNVEQKEMKAEIERVNTNFQKKTSEVLRLRQLMRKAEAETTSKVHPLVVGIARLTTSKAELSPSMAVVESEARTNEMKVSNLMDQISGIRLNEADAQLENSALEGEIIGLLAKLDEMKAYLSRARISNASLFNDVESHSALSLEKDDTIKKLQSICDYLESRVKALSRQLASLEYSSVRAKEECQTEKTDLTNSLASVNLQNEDLKLKLRALDENQSLERKSTSEKTVLEAELSNLQDKVETLYKPASDESGEVSSFSEQLEIKETQIAQVIKDEACFSNKLKALCAASDEQKMLIDTLESRSSIMQTDLGEMREINALLSTRLQYLAASLEQKEKELLSAACVISQLRNEATTPHHSHDSSHKMFDSELESTRGQIEFLALESSSCNGDATYQKVMHQEEKLLMEKNLLEKDKLLREKKFEIEELSNNLACLEESRESYKSETSAAAVSERHLWARSERKYDGLQLVHSNIQHLSNELNFIRCEFVSAIAEIKQITDFSFHALNEKLRSEVQECQRKNEYRREIESIRNTEIALINKTISDISLQSFEVESINQQRDELISSLSRNLCLAEGEMDQINSNGCKVHKRGILELKNESAGEEQAVLGREIEIQKKLESYLIEWKQERLSLEERISSLSDQLEKARLRNDDLARSLDEVTSNLKSKEDRVAALSSDLSLAGDVISSMTAEINCIKHIKREIEAMHSFESASLIEEIRLLECKNHEGKGTTMIERAELQQQVTFLLEQIDIMRLSHETDRSNFDAERNDFRQFIDSLNELMKRSELNDTNEPMSGMTLVNALSKLIQQNEEGIASMNIDKRCPHMTQNIFGCGEDLVLSISYLSAFESAFGKLRKENQRLKDDFLLMKNEKSSKLSSLISDIE